MEFIDELREKRFWLEWKDRFTDNHRRYINPDHRTVANYADGLSVNTNTTPFGIAEQLWRHVDNNYSYKLSKEWKEPQKTIRQMEGDCEDYVFLIGSLLPHFGVHKFEVVIGEVKVGDLSELHTWMRVSGKTVDPTTGPDEMDGLNYVEEEAFLVEVGQ